jgi:hypothetical protein
MRRRFFRDGSSAGAPLLFFSFNFCSKINMKGNTTRQEESSAVGLPSFGCQETLAEFASNEYAGSPVLQRCLGRQARQQRLVTTARHAACWWGRREPSGGMGRENMFTCLNFPATHFSSGDAAQRASIWFVRPDESLTDIFRCVPIRCHAHSPRRAVQNRRGL